MTRFRDGDDSANLALGNTLSDELEKLCCEFDLELDEVTMEKQIITKEQGAVDAAKDASEDVIDEIDIPDNRYDLLCLERLVQGLQVFLGKMNLSLRRLHRRKVPAKAEATSFKLHKNICRKRALVAIGTHELDTLMGTFTYDVKAPKDIKFVLLNVQPGQGDDGQGVDGVLLDAPPFEGVFADHLRFAGYPVIYDANGVALSLPPITIKRSSWRHGTRSSSAWATPTSASTKTRKTDQLEVLITSTQHDMLHVYDIYEDVANAYGYNRIPKTLPATMHIARQYPLNKLTEQLREQIAQAGFTENLAFTPPSRNDIAVKQNQNI
ncbi:phenylalanyl-tRNA synthetase beta chain [Culex quinquefasciatus]|uniref:Phenylalanyl-tRNA synthetase beta chain n=1 Tax=Culex quinquefasciatus TaxID=7176 RepID=B0X602_CULQU|nr:phenylalanyl-tRNA synthetase beta chain [Culex quinquefasciatus]|eukprot:XP_001865074.1 phenylalanyl-tRNA synthetase beta chain [Culex quinquefasciatus]